MFMKLGRNVSQCKSITLKCQLCINYIIMNLGKKSLRNSQKINVIGHKMSLLDRMFMKLGGNVFIKVSVVHKLCNYAFFSYFLPACLLRFIVVVVVVVVVCIFLFMRGFLHVCLFSLSFPCLPVLPLSFTCSRCPLHVPMSFTC